MKKQVPALFRHLLMLLVFSFLLELFLFNFRHWLSLSYTQAPCELSYGAGLSKDDDGILTVVNPDSAYIEILFSPSPVYLLHLDIRQTGTDENTPVQIQLQAVDEGSAVPYTLPETAVIPPVGRSQYIPLHLSGQGQRLLIFLNHNPGTRFTLRNLALNPPYPLGISLPRLAACFFLLMILYFLLPRNGYYQVLCKADCHWQKAILIVFALAQVLLFCLLIREANYSTNPADSPYPILAETLADGHFALDIEPSPDLLAMDNPYDTLLRDRLQVSYRWDYAYYHGHYYVYFGVTRVLLAYLPYYLLTGDALPLQITFYLCSILFTAGCLLLLWKTVTVYFKRTPFPLFLLLAAAFINGFGAFYLFAHPKFYSEANLFALVFAVWGFYFWFSALHTDNRRQRIAAFTMGSLCMALIAGCRPQMLLLCFLSIPLLWRFFYQKENRFYFIPFLLPLVLFGIWIMYYNYARFGSILDFGANYNLTSNDMTQRGFVPARIPLGIFSYLFQPVQLNSQFPYIEEIQVRTSYMGITISEGIYGGLLWSTPLTALCFALPSAKESLKEKNLWGFSLLSILFGVCLVILDTEMAGILPRYYSDFSLFFLFPALLFLLSLLEETENSPWRSRWLLLPLLLCIAGLCYQFFMIFADKDTNLNDILFNRISYLIQFWK